MPVTYPSYTGTVTTIGGTAIGTTTASTTTAPHEYWTQATGDWLKAQMKKG